MLTCLKCQEPRSALANGAHRESELLPRLTSKISNTLPSFCHPVLSFPTHPQKCRNVPEEPTNKWKQRVRTAMAGVKLVLSLFGGNSRLDTVCRPSWPLCLSLAISVVCSGNIPICVLSPPLTCSLPCVVMSLHGSQGSTGSKAASCGVLETCLSRVSTIASFFLVSMHADTSGMSGLPRDISASMLSSSVFLSLKAPPTHT